MSHAVGQLGAGPAATGKATGLPYVASMQNSVMALALHLSDGAVECS